MARRRKSLEELASLLVALIWCSCLARHVEVAVAVNTTSSSEPPPSASAAGVTSPLSSIFSSPSLSASPVAVVSSIPATTITTSKSNGLADNSTRSETLLDSNKELIDYGPSYLEALDFVQLENGLDGDQKTKSALIEKMLAIHHNQEALYEYLAELARDYPKITRLYALNHTSVEGEKLWAIEITENPGKHELLKPEFRYVANIHGNEVVGREMLLHLARLLCENYQQAVDEDKANNTAPSGAKFVRKLLKATRIHLLPTANPDGYKRSGPGCGYEIPSKRGRLNANNVDLNRNFPDPVLHNQLDAATQVEVRALVEWARSVPFVLSGSLHGGALVASYPYDGARNLSADHNAIAPTPDDDVFRSLALSYSQTHSSMHKAEYCPDGCRQQQVDNETFPEGITNGAAWYSLYGGMQDWMYEHTNDFEITLELGCNQYPDSAKLPYYWDQNKLALLSYIKRAHMGIKGLLRDSISGAPLANVTVHVLNRDHNVSSTDYGDYFRLLVPGNYEVLYEHPGYRSQRVFVTVQDTMALIININLVPLDAQASQQAALGFSQPIDGSSAQANGEPADDKPAPSAEHGMVVATLVLTAIILTIVLVAALCYLVDKRHLLGGRSYGMELQPARRQAGGLLGGGGTGTSIQVGSTAASQQQLCGSGSSINQRLPK